MREVNNINEIKSESRGVSSSEEAVFICESHASDTAFLCRPAREQDNAVSRLFILSTEFVLLANLKARLLSSLIRKSLVLLLSAASPATLEGK